MTRTHPPSPARPGRISSSLILTLALLLTPSAPVTMEGQAARLIPVLPGVDALHAQVRPEPGTPVRITPIQGRRMEGELLRASSSEVVLLIHVGRNARERLFAPDEIRLFEVGVDEKRNVEGTVVGYTAVFAAVGALGGLAAAPCTQRSLFGCVDKDFGEGALKGAAVGGAAGLLVGILMSRSPARRWEPASLPGEEGQGSAFEALFSPRFHLDLRGRGGLGLVWNVPVGGG